MEKNSVLSNVAVILAVTAAIMFIAEYFTDIKALINIGAAILGAVLILIAIDVWKTKKEKKILLAGIFGAVIIVIQIIILIVKYIIK